MAMIDNIIVLKEAYDWEQDRIKAWIDEMNEYVTEGDQNNPMVIRFMDTWTRYFDEIEASNDDVIAVCQNAIDANNDPDNTQIEKDQASAETVRRSIAQLIEKRRFCRSSMRRRYERHNRNISKLSTRRWNSKMRRATTSSVISWDDGSAGGRSKLIEFAVAEHVRSKFPARETSGREQPDRGRCVAAVLAQQAFEEAAKADSERDQIACREGCSYCCHMRVVATVPEIIALHDFIVAQLSASEIAELGRRIVALDEATHGLSDEQWGVGHYPCPVLVDGFCSAYAARPLDCRGYNSTNVAACSDAARRLSRVGRPDG